MKKILLTLIFLLPIFLFSCSGSSNESELEKQLEIDEQKNQELKLEKELELVKEQNQALIEEAEAKAKAEAEAKAKAEADAKQIQAIGNNNIELKIQITDIESEKKILNKQIEKSTYKIIDLENQVHSLKENLDLSETIEYQLKELLFLERIKESENRFSGNKDIIKYSSREVDFGPIRGVPRLELWIEDKEYSKKLPHLWLSIRYESTEKPINFHELEFTCARDKKFKISFNPNEIFVKTYDNPILYIKPIYYERVSINLSLEGSKISIDDLESCARGYFSINFIGDYTFEYQLYETQVIQVWDVINGYKGLLYLKSNYSYYSLSDRSIWDLLK